MGPGKQSFEYFRNFSITFNVQNKVLTTLPLPVQFNQLTTVTLRYATWARAYHGPPICVRGFRGRRQKEERERWDGSWLTILSSTKVNYCAQV